MGMFDEVRIKFNLAEKYGHLQNLVFQTKSLDCLLDKYLIDSDGYLEKQDIEYVDVPEEKRPFWGKPEWETPFGKFIGCMESSYTESKKCTYTGEIRMYCYDERQKIDCDIITFFDNGKMIFVKVTEGAST
jgi:hypothetical protein